MKNHFTESEEATFFRSQPLSYFRESLHTISEESIFFKKLFADLLLDSAALVAVPNAPSVIHLHLGDTTGTTPCIVPATLPFLPRRTPRTTSIVAAGCLNTHTAVFFTGTTFSRNVSCRSHRGSTTSFAGAATSTAAAFRRGARNLDFSMLGR